jgi:FMN phosphatase YigB (HAD superfamily)
MSIRRKIEMKLIKFAIVLWFGSLVLNARPYVLAGILESWNDGPTKQTILSYVNQVTQPGSPDFIAKDERIAVFDNDGTLWAERPVPVQLQFAVERVQKLAPQHSEWKNQQPFKAAVENDMNSLMRDWEKNAWTLLEATHVGMTQEEFMKIAQEWIKESRDPKSGLSYPERAYQPMVELLKFLKDNGFKTYIVTGGGRDFVRTYAETTYGIPPEQIIGTSIQTRFKIEDGKPVFIREAKIVDPLNINEGKAININREIGRVPVFAVGNGDVDLQMMQYTASSPHRSLEILVRHDDEKREYAYTTHARKIIDEAKKDHWIVASMKNDFRTIFQKASEQLGGNRGE